MPSPSLLEMVGAPKVRQQKFAPIYIRRFFTGLYTNRSPLLPPGSRVDERFYGGRPDALLDGLNIELSSAGILQRRPGFVAYSTATLPNPAQAFYSWRNLAGSLFLVASCSDGVYSLSPTAASKIFSKTGAAQANFLSVGNWCYFGDGTDLGKWNGTVAEKWGISSPATAPTLGFASAGAVWAANTAYALNATITDPFQNTQKCTAAGTSGANAPTWQRGPGQTTSDGTAVWTNEGHNSSAGVFEQSGASYLYCYRNSTTGHYSTASPVSAGTGQQANQNITVQGAYSTDQQVDQVAVFRTADGGSTWLYLAEVANNSAGGTWSFVDTNADSVLNPLIAAPIDHANDPPPTGLLAPAYHAGRAWGAVGNSVYYSGGPDTVVGNGNEAFPPANVFQFPSQVMRLVPYSGGLLVFTVDQTYCIRGVDATSFYVQLYIDDLGISSYNALDTLGSTIYAFTTDRQFVAISASGVLEVGFPIGNLLEQLTPANVRIACHIAGSSDKAVYLADGAATIYRLNPNQQPEGGAAWSAKAQPLGGVGAIGSVETVPGTRNLLMTAPSGANLPILGRSLNTFSDNGTAYPAWLVQGSITLANPGQLAEVQSLTLEAAAVGTAPEPAVLLDEIGGSFTGLAASVPDPPQLGASSSMTSQRFYMSQNAEPTVCRHMQIEVAFATEAAQSQLIGLSIFGAQFSTG